MTHDKFCRFANDGRSTNFKNGCFDCHRLVKAREDEREQIAQKIEAITIRDVENVKPLHFAQAVQQMAANVARGS